MSLLIWSDLHLDNFRRFSTILPNGLNSRLNDQIKVVNQVCQIAKSSEIEAIVFLGDLFNGQGANINKLLYLWGYRIVQQLQEIAPLYLVVGNHDMYGGAHLFGPMAIMPNVIVIDSPQHINLLGMDAVLVPWGGMIPPTGDILLGHLDIEGIKTGLNYELPGTINPKEVQQFKLVISGHYHTYQQMPPNILYCGAVMPISFGDIAEEKYGVLILGSDLSSNHLPLDSSKFIPIRINSQVELNTFLEKRGQNYYRLSLTDRKITVPKFDHTVEIEWDIQEEMKTRLEYEIDTPLEDILAKYIYQCNTQIDKEQAIKVLKEIMEEC